MTNGKIKSGAPLFQYLNDGISTTHICLNSDTYLSPIRKMHMKISCLRFLKKEFFLLLLNYGVLILYFNHSYCNAQENNEIPASLIGVHHLGPNYIINRFYINKTIGDNVGEGGGGGSMICCVKLSQKWKPSLKVDVRWEVAHITKRSANPSFPDEGEIDGIYQARVPVEKYDEPGDFYVHFFPNGHVRIVISITGSDSEAHPIRSIDAQTLLAATKGKKIKALFTSEETAERQKAANNDRNNYGGWR
jgi:hypothetical protein